jgi:2-keto-4-pentenoate hydratase
MPSLLARSLLLAASALGACATVPRMAGAPTCPSDATVAEAARLYLAMEKLPAPPAEMTLDGAACGQAKLVAALAPSLGKPIGYKAGLTNPAVQKRFGIDRPLLGTLLEKMVVREGAAIPARLGVRPFLEADLVVEVGSSAIHEAATPEQALASLRAIYPFIELPDVILEDPSRITAASLTYYDVGARLGVLGKPLPVAGSGGLAEALRTMTVRTTDGAGKEVASGPGSAILGHPLQAVIWIAAELKRQGVTLQPGDLLSLGAFSAGAIQAGATVRVTYEGLPGNPSVQVAFP